MPDKSDKKLLSFLLITLTLVFLAMTSVLARADSADDQLNKINEQLQKKNAQYESTSKSLSDVSSKKDSIAQKLNALASQLGVTQDQIDELEAEIKKAQDQLAEINKNLLARKDSLTEKINLRNKIIRDYAKRGALNELELFFTVSPVKNLNGFEFSALNYIFQKSLNTETVKIMDILNKEIEQFESDKKEAESLKTDLETSQQKLVGLKNQLQVQKQSTQNELDNLQKQQDSFQQELSNISKAISDLTAKQQSILKEKYGTESETVGDYEGSSQDLPSPSFKPAYAFYTYGYPHRVGISQYGAYGRAKSGQKYKDIISAYFKNVKVEKTWNDNDKIPVQGYGNISMKNYLLGIGEMPESWGDKGGYEALKAQVVAARTYALNYIYYTYDSKSGTIKSKSPVSICTTQSCQVYTGRAKTGKWAQAVADTAGEVITYNGKPITAWFASTAGGYTRTSGQVWGSDRPWTKGISDTACGSLLNDCAYDGPKYGNSPWFHKAWDTGYPSKNAWLNESEVEDIINSYLIWHRDKSAFSHLSNPSKDDNAWDASELKKKLSDAGADAVGKIKTIKAYDDGNGYTTKIVVKSDNYSDLEIDGYDFRTIFNIRSRERLYIYTAFFSIRVEN